MKKATLTSIMLFVTFSGIILIGSLLPDKKQPNSINTAFDINSPNIDVRKLNFYSNNNTKDTFTVDQIAKHNFRNDCYIIINNKVYNVSAYISYHPGGPGTIISNCGKEVTGIFASIHSNRAWDLLKRYKIGTISTGKLNTTPQILTTISQALKKANPDAEIIKIRPKSGFYVAKIIYNGKLYEAHINSKGKIFKEEIENEEADWSLWENDNDDK